MANSNSGRFVWHELMTKDPKAAIAFYTEVVGWKTQGFGDDYTMWVSGNGPMGGVMNLPDEAAKMGAPPHWMASVGVDDVDAAAAKAKQLGGKIYKEPFDIPDVGRYAVIADPQGAPIAIFRPNTPMQLHDGAQPGEFCWNELMTTDQPAAFEFYSELFGWKKMNEMPMGDMGTYLIFGLGEAQLGGMMKKPDQAPMPPSWMYYTEVGDLNAAVERATKLGAKKLNEMDVPGGRMAQMIDPQGAAFALHQAKK